ncbi:3572_t:CDS:1, partial [Scutellospora calospora]
SAIPLDTDDLQTTDFESESTNPHSYVDADYDDETVDDIEAHEKSDEAFEKELEADKWECRFCKHIKFKAYACGFCKKK